VRDPNVPEALEGWSILHQMLRFDRRRWQQVSGMQRDELVRKAVSACNQMHHAYDGDFAFAQILGQKADLMVTYYARSFEALAAMQLRFEGLDLCTFFRPIASYLSILELGLYEATPGFHEQVHAQGLDLHSEAGKAAFDELVLAESREPRNGVRLWAKIPRRRYVTFYPMSRRRGEQINWYTLPYEERLRLMRDHGKVGRAYRDLVTQVISGSIGLDDWEWGVDLYADEPSIFKRLVYEMRFDEVSARYAEFGSFYTGLQFSIPELPTYLRGESVPQLHEEEASPLVGSGASRSR